MFDNIVFELALIFVGASVLSTIFLYLKQPIILAYIALGMIAGPWGLTFFDDATHIEHFSHLGIILLMFLLGLHLHPQELFKLLKKTSITAVTASSVFTLVTMSITKAFGFPWFDSVLTGLALMFSSTVICLKLIPTTTLHHKRIGEITISILLFQDILAIMLILFLYSSRESHVAIEVLYLLGKTFGLAIASYLIVKYILLNLFRQFDVIQDYIFVLSIGWCLLIAEAAKLIGLSYEIGAFIGGICIGVSPIALILAEALKPLREFFLILFFFSIGAKFDLFITKHIFLPGAVIAVTLIILKPITFSILFRLGNESKSISNELGFRLGQASEFSLLVAYGAVSVGRISPKTSYLIQFTTILTFIISTYIVVYKYPTPIASQNSLRKD